VRDISLVAVYGAILPLLLEIFNDFSIAETAVLDYCRTHFRPVRVDMKEQVSSYNKKSRMQ